MTRYSRMLFGLLVVAACTTMGCSVAFDDLSKGETFQCSEDADCIEGFVCDPNKGSGDQGLCVEACSSSSDCDNNQVCQEQLCVPGCVDEDGDGYGSSQSRALELCSACSQDNQQACTTPDCKDNNESIHPGVAEACDGKDNDCDGTIDEPISCENNADCPLSAPSGRSGTGIECQPVDRSGETQKECVLVGQLSRNNCDASQNKATCQNGEWGDLPEGCTQ